MSLAPDSHGPAVQAEWKRDPPGYLLETCRSPRCCVVEESSPREYSDMYSGRVAIDEQRREGDTRTVANAQRAGGVARNTQVGQ